MMAASGGLDIPFSSSHTQKTFKLLELPNELLALLESDNPPTICLETCPQTNLALLTTPAGLKYRVQQKNSSNPLLILNPSMTSRSLPVGIQEDGPSVTAIAKIEDTLELLPYVAEDVKEKKVNKWHEKFAKTRKK